MRELEVEIGKSSPKIENATIQIHAAKQGRELRNMP
jgi:hypothetical protein